MGGSLQVQKIKQTVIELSETTDLNETFLMSQFGILTQLTGGDNAPYEEIQNLFIQMINESNFSEDNLINFAFNALSFYNLSFNHTSYFGIKTTLFFLLIVVNTLKTKYENNFDSFIAHYIKVKGKMFEDMNYINMFPFNVLKYSINAINDKEHIIQNNKEINPLQKNSILYYAVLIVYEIICSIDVLNSQRNYIDKIDLFKFILNNSSFISEDDFSLFYSKIILFFFSTFENVINNKTSFNSDEIETYIQMLLKIIIFFLEDTNHFLFEEYNPVEVKNKFCYETEHNEIYNRFISDISKDNIYNLIMKYRKDYKETFVLLVQSNYRLFNEFMECYFNSFDSVSDNFSHSVNYFLLLIFEYIPNFFEICSIKDLVPMIFTYLSDKLIDDLTNFKLIILLNKIMLTQTFYNLIKDVIEFDDNDDYNIYRSCVNIILAITNKASIVKNRNLIMLYLITLQNITSLLSKINFDTDDSELVNNKFFSILYNLMKQKENIKTEEHFIEYIILFKYYLRIMLLLSYKSDQNSFFLLNLVKNYTMIEEYYLYLTKSIQNSEIKNIIDEAEIEKNSIKEIFTKINSKIKSEGIDIAFGNNAEMRRIINKILLIEPPHIKQIQLNSLTINHSKIEKEIFNSNFNIENIYTILNKKVLSEK